MGDATNERCESRNVCVCCCCCGSTTNELRHGVHRGYSSINSQIISDASVPPTVIKDRSPYKNCTLPNGPEYTFASLYSLRLLMHGYLISVEDSDFFLVKHYNLIENSFWIWIIPKETNIAISIATREHIMGRWSITRGNRCRCIWIVAIVPHTGYQETYRTILCKPFNVFHCNWTSFGWQWSHIPYRNTINDYLY